MLQTMEQDRSGEGTTFVATISYQPTGQQYGDRYVNKTTSSLHLILTRANCTLILTENQFSHAVIVCNLIELIDVRKFTVNK